jgi:tRNA pseudouridine55 synthase
MARRRRADSSTGPTGCCVIDKPPGCTSHDVVDRVRRQLGTRRVGHAGTLDPDATGVLVVGVGRATRLLQFVTGTDKSYEGEIVFGVETSTLDAGGVETARHDMGDLDPAAVSAAAARFVGDIEQIPPMVSAVKVDGRRLHELAREGQEVERKPRRVRVDRFDGEPTDDPSVYRAHIECSSGTYIRSLAADLGRELGGGAHLRNLRRTRVGPFAVSEARDLDELDLRPAVDLVGDLPRIEADAELAAMVAAGRGLGPASGSGRVAVVDAAGHLLAVYEVVDGQLRPAVVLVG